MRPIEDILKEKKIIFSLWACEDTNKHTYENYYLCLKELFDNIILFDPRENRFRYGHRVREIFLDLIRKEKPDFIFLSLGGEEFSVDFFQEINTVSPKTKTIVFLGDDDDEFETLSRYYALYIDYFFVSQIPYIPLYNKEGITRIVPTLGTNISHYRPLNLNKEYDVLFYGYAYKDRVETLRFLIKNGINVKIFGPGWINYPEFKEYYGGILNSEELVEAINKTKINLCLTKSSNHKLHITGRIFESGACKVFALQEYYKEYYKFFKDDEMAMFKDDSELLRKIKYYLKHEEERERIVLKAHKKVLKKYNLISEYKQLFKMIIDEEKSFVRKLPKVNKKIVCIRAEDFRGDILSKVENADYITFKSGDYWFSEHKNYLQSYALNLLKKDICYCDYSVYGKGIGYFMTSDFGVMLKEFDKEEFDNMLNLNQLMVTKDFFVEHLKDFKRCFDGSAINFVNSDNSALISIPVAGVSKFHKLDYNMMCRAFRMNFTIKIYSLLRQKEIDSYYLKLISYAVLSNNWFIIRHLIKVLVSKENFSKLKNLCQ